MDVKQKEKPTPRPNAETWQQDREQKWKKTKDEIVFRGGCGGGGGGIDNFGLVNFGCVGGGGGGGWW